MNRLRPLSIAFLCAITAVGDLFQPTWLRALREWASLQREKTDEEIVDEDRHGEDYYVTPRLPGGTVVTVRF